MMKRSSPFIRVSITILALLLAHSVSNADEGFTPNLHPTYNVVRLNGSITIDGNLDDTGWQGVARASNFSEQFPNRGRKAPVETEVMLTYDDENLYIAFICYDPDASSIRTSWSDRDIIWNDDYMGIIFDTYADGVWAYEIFVNPIGLQGDGMQVTSGGEDMGFDLIFDSRGVVTDSGYQVELAIPFASLRFPDKPEQLWKATFWRTRPRESRSTSSWANIPENSNCWICEFGTLTGIKNIKPGKNLEIMPAIVSHQSAEIRDYDDPDSGLKNDKIDAEASIGMRYSLTSSTSAELSINPDFSQVESDASQIDVNETFALSYPEKRPFFQEGSDLFSSWIDVVYTRSINNPSVAGKLIGRMGKTSLAYLGAVDKDSPIILPLEERSGFAAVGESYSNIVRYKRAFGGSRTVGALFSDRHYKVKGGNSVLGFDFDIPFKERYRIRTQVIGSYTTEPDDTLLTADMEQRDFDGGKYTTAFDGESFGGHAAYIGISRETRSWYIDGEYLEHSPTFRADNGIVTRNDFRWMEFQNSFNIFPDKWLIDQIQPGIEFARIWNSYGKHRDGWIAPYLFIQMKAQTGISLHYTNTQEDFRGEHLPTMNRFATEISSNFSEPVQAGFYVEVGPHVARNEDPAVLGDGLNYTAWVDIKPFSRLKIEQVYRYSELKRQDNGEEIFQGFIYRAKANYQFSREMFLRLVVQYDDFGERLDIDPLLSYKLNAFSIFYIGSTMNYYDLDKSNELTLTSRQYFAKFQYLFRM